MARWRKWWLGALVVLVVGACGGGASGQGGPAPHNNTLLVAIGGDPYSLDPAQALGVYDLQVMTSIYDTLLKADPKTLKPAPGLATSWSFVGPDKLTFRLALRHGVRFQDGTPFDAQAVKTSLDHYRSLKIERDLDPVSSVSVVDPYTVELHLSSPYSPLPGVLTERAGMIVSPTALQRYGSGLGQHPVGTGPFALQSWRPGTEYKLTKFSGYWQKGQPKLNGIDYKVIASPTSQVSAITSGQVDFASSLDPTNLPALKGNGNLVTNVWPTVSMALVQLNTGLAPLNNALVRQALNLALDRKALAEAAVGKGVGPGAASQYVPPSYWTFSKSLQAYRHDPAEAKRLLAQAGFPNGVSFNLCTPDTTPTLPATVEKQNLAQAGITLNVSVEPLRSCGVKMTVQKSLTAFQVGWSGRPDPYNTYYDLFATHGTYNTANTTYPGVDELLARIAATYTQQEQKPLYDQLDKVVFDAAPEIPLYYTVNVGAASKRVSGVVCNLEGTVFLRDVSFTSAA